MAQHGKGVAGVPGACAGIQVPIECRSGLSLGPAGPGSVLGHLDCYIRSIRRLSAGQVEVLARQRYTVHLHSTIIFRYRRIIVYGLYKVRKSVVLGKGLLVLL